MADDTRIALEWRDGQWKRPDCECAFHYFDGKPKVVSRERQEGVGPEVRKSVTEQVRLEGVEAPHIHLCERHADQDYNHNAAMKWLGEAH